MSKQYYIQSLLSKHLNKLQNESLSTRRTDKFNVSDSGSCFRKRILKRVLGSKKIEDERLLSIFQVGHLFHEWLQSILDKEKLVVSMEEKLENEHFIGHYDMIMKNPDNLEEYLLMDFKTVHSRKFNYIKDKPDIHYQKQVLTYYDMLTELKPDIASKINPEKISIVYISKDDLRIQELTVDFFLLDDVKRENDNLVSYWEKGIIPEGKPFQDWECRYCQYKKECDKINQLDVNFINDIKNWNNPNLEEV